ncbi:MAG: hypothetical protein D6797_09245 [Bdellovibrio sp.]|nr:MAG: hypothetical protein D6797_09245 [Bdellovibrio sp.]
MNKSFKKRAKALKILWFIYIFFYLAVLSPSYVRSAQETKTEEPPPSSIPEKKTETSSPSSTAEKKSDSPSSTSEQTTNPQSPSSTPEKESSSPAPLNQVQWFYPELGLSPKEKRTAVLFSGEAAPGTTITLAEEKIPVLIKQKIFYIKKENLFLGPTKVIADDTGYFEITLHLPISSANIPFEVTFPSGEKKIYQFNIKVKEASLETPDSQFKKSPYRQKKWSLWAGTGINILNYQQEAPAIPASLNLTTAKFPSFYARVERFFFKDWKGLLSFSLSPGAAKSSDQITISKENYNWIIFSLESVYFPEKWKKLFKQKYLARWGIRGGLQQHFLPFIARTGTNASQAEVATNPVTMITLGGQYMVSLTKRWAVETFLRYQYPVISGNLFEIKPKFAFDGSIGTSYKWRHQWKVGVFWYGQWHSYGFSHMDKYFENTGSGSNPSTGTQSLFFSNLELRIGYEFN